MADVTIMGAGVFGLSVAWSCLQKDAHVMVIDPHGVGGGSSGGVVGALAPHVPENWNEKKAFQFDSLIMAEAFWAEVAEAAGQSPGYARLGRLQPLADDRAVALAQERAVNAQTLWQSKAVWEVVAADTLDWAPPSATGLLAHDTLSARLHPRQASAALAAAIRARGGVIATEGEPCGQVIWCTGVAGLKELTEAHTRIVGNGVKGQGAVLDFNAANQPQLFVDALHFIPHEDGTTAIGSTSERDYDDPTSTDTQLDEIITRARQLVPALKDALVLKRWAGVRPRTRSRAPMLGNHPLRPDEFIANGGFKIGFGMAPKVGQVMAELVLDGVDAIPSEFRPEMSY
ncbi:Glycine oxidase [Roseovarius albus]|uniref:Glycine oxidase n=1 Tax=Roseovarius albus TaxID=1247867 RepID=A0A1X6ZIL0_9RHOB|nr:FAD-dependent oxidoreductase [Roseovarius albus]SLN52769.1 Glycine oxidase [Roseovarius albus]